jgi:hypothetical protein
MKMLRTLLVLPLLAFTRASFFNSVCSADLKDVVERAISESEREMEEDYGENDDSEIEPF